MKHASKPNATTPQLPLGVGCPVWNCDAWAEVIYPARTNRSLWLSWYSSMFNAVEGNSTFYALPELALVKKWASFAASGFRFCMKFPREISHDMRLRGAERATGRFLQVLEVLGAADKLGPAFLQLGPDFSPNEFGALETYLTALPSRFSYAVEVRHPGWFDDGPHERALNKLLESLKINRVLFDSRALFQSAPSDSSEAKAQSRKPRPPLRMTATGRQPMVRFVGRNKASESDEFFQVWLPIVAAWIEEGRSPIVFTHAPDDQYAPELGRRFWEQLVPHLNDLEKHGKAIREGGRPAVYTPEDLPRLPPQPVQLDLAF